MIPSCLPPLRQNSVHSFIELGHEGAKGSLNRPLGAKALRWRWGRDHLSRSSSSRSSSLHVAESVAWRERCDSYLKKWRRNLAGDGDGRSPALSAVVRTRPQLASLGQAVDMLRIIQSQMHAFGDGRHDSSIKATIQIKRLHCNEGLLYV